MVAVPDTGRTGQLDVASLRRVRLRDRWRVLGGSGRLLVAVSAAAVMALGCGLLLAALAVTGGLGDDVAFTVVASVIPVLCLLVVADGLHQAGTGAALRSFARANGLLLVETAHPDEYAAPPLRSGDHVVQHAVRLPGGSSLVELREIGDRFPVGGPIGADAQRTPMAYLRVRLAGRVPRRPELADALVQALREWAGDHEVDLHLGELTVLGTRPLEAQLEGRVATGLALLDELVAVTEVVPLHRGDGPAPGLPDPEPVRRRSPVAVVLVTVALFVGLVAGITVLGNLTQDETLGNRPAAIVLVGVVLTVVLGAVTALARWAVSPRRADPLARRRDDR